jgi:hypothetical protein
MQVYGYVILSALGICGAGAWYYFARFHKSIKEVEDKYKDL